MQRAVFANVKNHVVRIVTTVLKGLSNAVFLIDVLSDLLVVVLWWSLELTERFHN
jgi:hypothetical protein